MTLISRTFMSIVVKVFSQGLTMQGVYSNAVNGEFHLSFEPSCLKIQVILAPSMKVETSPLFYQGQTGLNNPPKHTLVLVIVMTFCRTSICWLSDVRHPIAVYIGWDVLVSAV